jgi:hypothetical protein
MIQKRPGKTKKQIINVAYDFDSLYAFWCGRYRDISIEEFEAIGLSEFNIKISSIPENEPLYTIIKSRTINTESIKDKDERKYWRNLKRINKIPDEYLSLEEIYGKLKVGGINDIK